MSDKDRALRTLVKGAGISVIGLAVTKVIGFLYQLVTARLLGPEGYGVLSLGIMVFSISATLVMLGLPAGVKRFVSMYRSQDKENLERGTIITALEVGLLTSVIGGAILFLASDLIAVYAFGDPNVAIVIKILAFAVPMRAIMSISLNTSIAYKKIEHKIYTRNITEGVVKIIVTAVLLYLGYDLLGASIGVLAGWFAAAMGALYLVERKVMPDTSITSSILKRDDVDRPISELVSFSTPLIFSSVFGQITSWADVFLVGFFLSSAAVGQYNVALATAMMLGMVSAAIGSLSIPVLTELYGKGKSKEFKGVYKTSTKWISIFVFPAALLMMLFANQGLSFLYGNEYIQETITLFSMEFSQTGLALGLLAAGYLLFALTSISRQAIQSVGETQYNLNISAIVGITNILLNITLIPILGIVGAALATATSWLIGGFASIYFLYRENKSHPFSGSMISIAAASAIATVVPYIVANMIYETVPKWFIFPAFGLFGLIYGVCILLFKVPDEDDKMIIKSIEKKTGIELPYVDEILEKFS